MLDPTQVRRRRILLPIIVSGVGAAFAAESLAIFAAFTTPPTDARKTLINNCVVSLKSTGVWSKLDALYLFAAADSQAALINWKNPGTFNATTANGPTFTADRGYTGNGTDSYVDSNFNPTTASLPNFVQNSAVIFGWSLTSGQNDNGFIGYGAGSFNTRVTTRTTGDLMRFRANSSGGGVDVANTNGSGLYASNRSASTTNTGYKNGSSVGTSSEASAAPDNATFTAGRASSGFSTNQIAAFGFGGSLASGEHSNLYSAILAYMQGVGAA